MSRISDFAGTNISNFHWDLFTQNFSAITIIFASIKSYEFLRDFYCKIDSPAKIPLKYTSILFYGNPIFSIQIS